MESFLAVIFIIIHGDITVNGRPIPLALAVKSILSSLNKYGEVKIQMYGSHGVIKNESYINN